LSTFWQVARVALGLCVAGFFAWLAFGRVDWAETRHTMSVAEPAWILAGIGIIAVDYFLRIVRWWLIIRRLAPRISIRQCAGPFLASVAVENLVGFRSGDLLRTFGFRSQLGITPSQALSTVVVEHLFGLVTLLMVFAAALSRLGPETLLGPLAQYLPYLVVVTLLSLVLIVLNPSWFQRRMDFLCRRSGGFARDVPSRIFGWAAKVFASFAMINSPATLLGILLLSLFLWVLEGTAFEMIARSLSIEHAGLGPWLSLAGGTLAMLIPGGPGGIGTFDYFAISGMMTYGVARGEATVFAILAHLLVWLPPTLAGMVCFAIYLKKGASLKTTPPSRVSEETQV
jgi:glycosyltransferase 2 family protein